ncbi:MAG: hypothetical protein ACE5GS_12225 [Kiloniellaceae bacterium]
MEWLRAAALELFALFVDDVPFTVAIVVWLGAGIVLLPRLDMEVMWDAPLLFLGCTVILVESVRRTARRHRRETEKPGHRM